MPKKFGVISTQVEESVKEKFKRICKANDCTPFSVLKDLVTDYIESYPEPIEDEEPQKKLDDMGGLNEPRKNES
jgi:hypothetical protein